LQHSKAILTSEVFTVSPPDYLRCLAGIWLRKYGLLFVIPAVVFAVLSMGDLRFLILSLMVVLLIVPLMMPLWYYYYMLTPEAAAAVLPKSVVIDSGNAISVKYEDPPEDSPWKRRPDETLAWSELRRSFRHRHFIVYQLDRPRIQLLIIPLKCLKANYAGR